MLIASMATRTAIWLHFRRPRISTAACTNDLTKPSCMYDSGAGRLRASAGTGSLASRLWTAVRDRIGLDAHPVEHPTPSPRETRFRLSPRTAPTQRPEEAQATGCIPESHALPGAKVTVERGENGMKAMDLTAVATGRRAEE